MPDVLDKNAVVFIGRLASMPRRVAASMAREHGAAVRQGLTRKTNIVVIGHGAHNLLKSEKLNKILSKANAVGARCLSENQFLVSLGLLELDPAQNGTITLDVIISQSGLDAATVQILALFDLVQPGDGTYGFRDLVASKEAARILDEGVSLVELIAAVEALRKGDRSTHHLAHSKLVRSDLGGIAMKVGNSFAELSGQLLLPLPSDNDAVYDMFEQAEEAEANENWSEAERLYRQCTEIDRFDPVAPFNLANVLREQGRTIESRRELHRSVAIDPGFAEAWYNLGYNLDQSGDTAEAVEHYKMAVRCDENYNDALFNLARLQTTLGNNKDAINTWEKYLSLDSASDWSQTAREGLALCRQQSLADT